MSSPILVIALVAAVVVIVAAVIAIIVIARRRSAPDAPAPPAPRDPFAPDESTAGDPRTIRAGDLLQFGDDKAWVRGSIRFQEGQYTWAEHFFQADTHATRQWLSVEEDPDVQLAVWRDREGLTLEPGPRQLVVDGIDFRFTERGTASFTAEGTTGMPAQGTVEYADYEASDGTLLGFERFSDGTWEVSMGRPLPLGSFTIYPGGGA